MNICRNLVALLRAVALLQGAGAVMCWPSPGQDRLYMIAGSPNPNAQRVDKGVMDDRNGVTSSCRY